MTWGQVLVLVLVMFWCASGIEIELLQIRKAIKDHAWAVVHNNCVEKP